MVLFLIFIPTEHNFYRPQRSWGKVIFSQASVILSRGGVCSRGCLVRGWGGAGPGGWSGPGGRLFWGCQGGAWSGGIWSGGVWSGGAWWRPPQDGCCCGRYASYWNAFLWKMLTHRGYFSCLNGSVTKENSFVLYGN